ncbi:MAG TPA: hypothetical protein VEK07_24835 [Polyangiaceae bacterium]|nr:hypothetical protein [Polyangiaceae bacterium]
MLGFVIGGIAAIGFIKLMHRRHAGGCARFYGGDFGAVRRGFGPRFLLRSLFERLETTPAQERAIVAALERLRENRTLIRDELRQTRDDVARVIEGALADDTMLDEAFARHDRLLAQLRVLWVETLKAISETLDERQRKELASILRRRHFLGRACRDVAHDFRHPVAPAWDL